MRIALAVAATMMAAGLVSFPGGASAAPAGPSAALTQAGDGLHVEVRAKRKSSVKSARGMRKIPAKKGL